MMSLNTTDMLLLDIAGSSNSHSVSDSFVETLMNWFAGVSTFSISVSTRSFFV